MLDTTTEAGDRAERRLLDEEIAWLTTVLDAIMLSRTIGVYAPGEVVDPKMEIIIVLE